MTADLAQRAVVLKQFRELLLRQRDRFRNYLVVLDQQQIFIESANADGILAHVEMEEQIVADIFSIQKVIDPLETMYNNSEPCSSELCSDVPSIKNVLEDLKLQAIARSSRNKEQLSARMAEIRSEINTLRSNTFAAVAMRPVYQNINSASLVSIQG